MSAAYGAGPRAKHARGPAGQHRTERGWANVGPPDRGSAGIVGEWIDLIARMSHDLRTPLNAVIGFSDAMQQELFGPIGNARYEEYVRHIRASGVEVLHAAELALAMTAVLAEPRTAAAEELALAPLVAGVVEELATRDTAAATTIAVAVPDGLVVRTDSGFLRRAFRQLLTIALSRAAPRARIEIAAFSEHGLVDLAVNVSEVAAETPLILEGGDKPAYDLGLGRRDLAIWLAVALLDILDCRLTITVDAGAATLRTTLEEASQRDFFSSESWSRS
jgi:hypothetical protein